MKFSKTQTAALLAAMAAMTIGADHSESNIFLRSLTKASAGGEVGPQSFEQVIVDKFGEESPIFRSHADVRSTSKSGKFNFFVVTAGAGGYAKTEGDAATADASSTIVLSSTAFKLYSSQTFVVSQELVDDYEYDLLGDITALGLSKGITAFDVDAVAALESAGDYTADLTGTPGEVTLAAVAAIYATLPPRHRAPGQVRYVCTQAVADKLLALITTATAAQCAAIQLTAESVIVDANVTARKCIISNITKTLAIGMRKNTRVFVADVSAGKTFEVQPRLAVALRDETAAVGFSVKA